MVMGRRLRERARVRELVERRIAGREPPQDVHAALVTQCSPEPHGAVGERLLRIEPFGRHRIADDARGAMLAEKEQRSGGSVGHEHDPFELGLRLVDIAASHSGDQGLGRERGRKALEPFPLPRRARP